MDAAPAKPFNTGARAALMRRVQWLLGAAAMLLVLLLSLFGALARPELLLLDAQSSVFAARAPAPSSDVVIIAIDDQAIDNIQRWPWDRALLADVVREMTLAGSRVIALDVLFGEDQAQRRGPTGEDIDDDEALAGAIRDHGNVILSMRLPLGDAVMSDNEINVDAVLDRMVAQPALGRASVADALDVLWPPESEALQPENVLRRRRQAISAAQFIFKHDTIFSAPTTGADWPAGQHPELPIAELADNAAGLGCVSFNSIDADKVVRRYAPLIQFRSRLWPSLGLAAAARFVGVSAAEIHGIESGLELRPGASGTPYTLALQPETPSLGARVPMVYEVAWARPGVTWDRQFGDGEQHPGLMSIGFVLRPAIQDRAIRSKLQQVHDACREAAALGAVDGLKYEEAAAALGAAAPGTEAWQASFAEMIRLWNEVTAAVRPLIDGVDESTLSQDQIADMRALQSLVNGLPKIEADMRDAAMDIAETRRALKELLSGKMCFLGATFTAAAADVVATSIDARTPGVMLHAALANSVLTGYSRRHGSEWLSGVCILSMGLLGVLVGIRLGAGAGPVVLLGVCGVWFFGSGLVFLSGARLVVVVAAPMIAAGAGWLAVVLHRLLVEQRARRRTEERFRAYVSPAVVDILMNNPKLSSMAPQKRELTVLFSDIANFTTIAESLGSARTARLLATYLGAMTDILQKHGATLDKYLGDGIMAFWGAPIDDPDHAGHACAAAVEMIAAVERMNANQAFGGVGHLTVRIGLATGELMVGDFGNPPRNSSYTVIGDAANLAARLESANKMFGTRILVSPRTRECAASMTWREFRWRSIGSVRVKGKVESETLYELFADGAAGIAKGGSVPHAPRTDAWVNLTKHAVNSFQRREFDTALAAFMKLAAEFGDRTLSETYCSRIVEWQSRPDRDAEFDGTISLTEK